MLSRRAAPTGLTLLINLGGTLTVALALTFWFSLGVSLRIPDLALVTGVFSFNGKRTRLLTYCWSLALFLSRVYCEVFLRLWSTEIPIDLANWTPNPAAFISWRVNPNFNKSNTSTISCSMIISDSGAVDDWS
jgi:hypothetical protein